MSQVRVLVLYDGKWICSPSGYFLYNGGKTKGIILPEKITYQELVDRLYGIMKVDPHEYVIKMKAFYKANIPTMPVKIVDDDDVNFFVHENIAQPTESRSPLCITLERKETVCQEIEGCYMTSAHQTPAASGSESNQLSATVPGSQAIKVEEQNQNAFNDDPMANIFGTRADLSCGDGILAADLEVTKQHNDARRNDTPHDDRCDKLPIRRTNDTSSIDFNSYEDIACGKTFSSKKDLRKKLKLRAAQNNFAFKVIRSTKYRFEVVCADEKCKWRLRATKEPEDEYFEIKRFSDVHICTQPPAKKQRKQKAATGEGSIRKCGRCGAIGHYKQTCRSLMP